MCEFQSLDFRIKQFAFLVGFLWFLKKASFLNFGFQIVFGKCAKNPGGSCMPWSVTQDNFICLIQMIVAWVAMNRSENHYLAKFKNQGKNKHWIALSLFNKNSQFQSNLQQHEFLSQNTMLFCILWSHSKKIIVCAKNSILDDFFQLKQRILLIIVFHS